MFSVLPKQLTSMLAGGLMLASGAAVAQDAPPNILVIWGDDIGRDNISAYSHGIMGYQTPNIDRIAKEGALFTDHYAHQSCTAGRAAFVSGAAPVPDRSSDNRHARIRSRHS